MSVNPALRASYSAPIACLLIVPLKGQNDIEPLSLDMTVRSYSMRAGMLTQKHILPSFPGSPWGIVLDRNRRSIIVRDANKDELKYSLLEETENWTAWGSLGRNTDAQQKILGMCLTGPNVITIFDYNSYSLKEYEIALSNEDHTHR